jgi:hypothetical protein
MARHIAATLTIALKRPRGYQVVYILRYAEAAEAAAASTILRHAQLRAFLQHCALTPQAIDQLLTRVHAGSREVLDIGQMEYDHVERLLQRYAGR